MDVEIGFDVDLSGRNKAVDAAARSDAGASRLDRTRAALTLTTDIAEA